MIEYVCVMAQSEVITVKCSLFNNGVQQGNFFFSTDEAVLFLDILNDTVLTACYFSFRNLKYTFRNLK